MVADIAYMQDQQHSINRMHTLFAQQRAAFRAAPMPDADSRIRQLSELKAALLKHQDAKFCHRSKVLNTLASISDAG